MTAHPEERLHARTLGETGPRVVFVHGLFGQGKNWTTIARGLAGDHRVTLLDLPNHGHSPWTDRVDYVDMARTVAAELRSLGEPVTLVGHSMGGKVALQVALRHPELLRALVVVDIAPTEYPVSGGRTDDPDEEASPFADFIAAMRALDLGSLETRADADAALRAAVPSRMVRSFLLQSLVRDDVGGDGGWRWRLNLELLARDLGELRGFPEPPPGARYDGPVLWIAGANSHYVLPQDRSRMEELCPNTRLVRVKNAGHWVHSEQPEVFLATLRHFLDAVERRHFLDAVERRHFLDAVERRHFLDAVERRDGLDAVERRDGLDAVERRDGLDRLERRDGLDAVERRDGLERVES